MYLVSVMPLERKAHTDELSYFSSRRIPSGSIVSATWRKKTILALVVDSSEVVKNKIAIKESGFTIKKIQKVIGISPLLPQFISTCEMYKDEYGTSIRILFDSLIPKKIFEKSFVPKKSVKNNTQTPRQEVLVGSPKFLLEKYKKIIQRNMEMKKATLFVTPTQHDATVLEQELQENTTNTIFNIRNNKPFQDKNPDIYISTPASLGFPFQNLGSLVVTLENSHLYILRNNIHIKNFLKIFTQQLGIELIHSASIPSLSLSQDVKKEKIKIAVEEMSQYVPCEIIPMKDKKGVLDVHALNTLKKTIVNKGHVFLFAVRRGYAEVTICNDCKNTLRCKTCDRPLVLHRQGQKNWYLCHNCGTIEDTLRKCESCESWNLRPLGIGVDTIYEYVQKEFKDTPIYKIDTDTTTSQKKLKDTLSSFYKTGGILIGTEMALRHLDTSSINTSVIVSFDTLFALPHFSIEERMLETIFLMKEKTREPFFIQTLFSDQPIFKALENNSLEKYVQELLDDRKSLSYPPFGEIWVIEKICTLPELSPEKKHLETHLESFPFHLHSTKTKDKKMKLRATLTINAVQKKEFSELIRILKNAGYTFLYNPASVF